ncbi:hypothetical protein [Achromobacter phage Motura]|uniref:Uncharacterized protein n=1 Tax=Achromobacter phage Motura TaxID=2591403 RepID=A0A514CTC6_9CAUD|nr:hypothetical protein H1O15_gp261 [Achromobacter phage Motura]QDH83700.1 hypothetical protein [Achromobacter phage Motura]
MLSGCLLLLAAFLIMQTALGLYTSERAGAIASLIAFLLLILSLALGLYGVGRILKWLW